MKIAGKRKERDISFHADGALLREGALFNTDMQKMQSTFRFPRGVFRYKSHEEADGYEQERIGLGLEFFAEIERLLHRVTSNYAGKRFSKLHIQTEYYCQTRIENGASS